MGFKSFNHSRIWRKLEKLGILFILWISGVICQEQDATATSPSNTTSEPAVFQVPFVMPTNDGKLADLRIVVSLDAFKLCDPAECSYLCGTRNQSLGYCNTVNKKLCMCTATMFYTSELEGSVASVDRSNMKHKNCSVACNKRKSYARIWTKPDETLYCICLMDQQTPTGVTLCDEFAVLDLCKLICRSESAMCAFNGVCLCRNTWESFFKLEVPSVRRPALGDRNECSTRCSAYHHDYVPRVFDMRMNDSSLNKTYHFREKYCLCGQWMDLHQFHQTEDIIQQGFQLCTGLKCKRRCGMDEAICEPKLKRSCLCQRENIIIGDHLWSRLPTHTESKCFEACVGHGMDARVIEWNPFMRPEDQKFEPQYRKTQFQYLYDGKFCHCIKTEYDMHQYRPCTNELCRIICGHHEAVCDSRTRRACFCNTHQLPLGLGRRPDPGELNCDIACRYGLFDAKVLDLKWEINNIDSWGVRVSKYCTCTRTLTAADLTHCDPHDDQCPLYCGQDQAYCTLGKYCNCGQIPNILAVNPMVRLGNGREQDECGEKCRSWTWPVAEDNDSQPFIFDESLATCGSNCTPIDTSPWTPEAPGSYSMPDPLELKVQQSQFRRYCLCVKTSRVMDSPGSRFMMDMFPARADKNIPCFTNHTCALVGKGLHIIS